MNPSDSSLEWRQMAVRYEWLGERLGDREVGALEKLVDVAP